MKIIRKLIILLSVGILASYFLSGCATAHKADVKVLDQVNTIPPNASLVELEAMLGDILIGIGKAPRKDIGMVRESVIKLREQPNIVKALINHYNSLPEGQYSERKLILAVLGELQRMDAFDFLKLVIWSPLPDTPSIPEGLSQRDKEVLLQMKAVESVGFLRNEDGTLNNQTINELKNIMRGHTSPPVKITAIDTYMWNNNDSSEAASTLSQNLPSNYHKYVERPRFYHGANMETFNKRVVEWNNKFGRQK